MPREESFLEETQVIDAEFLNETQVVDAEMLRRVLKGDIDRLDLGFMETIEFPVDVQVVTIISLSPPSEKAGRTTLYSLLEDTEELGLLLKRGVRRIEDRKRARA